MSGYSAQLINGSDIYIPTWPVTVALENLNQAGQMFGSEHVITMAELNVNAVVVGIMQAKDANKVAHLVKHFVCQVRIDGSKIEPSNIDTMFEGQLRLVAELFAHIMHSQFNNFFVSGSAKVASPEAKSLEKKA